MENNIFLKDKKEKFNPDVIKNVSKKTNERKKIEFEASKTIYNPVTNQVPNNVKTSKDLKLEKDNSFNTNELKKIMRDKENERKKQEADLKPIKLKAIPEDLIIDKHIENFDELKKNSETHAKKIIQEHDSQKNKYDNIITSLKNLGIINK
jgi:hypothetical protein